jgi:hypothetical protein
MMNDEKNIRENSCNSWAVFVLDFENLNFEFVSNFGFRISDFGFILFNTSPPAGSLIP